MNKPAEGVSTLAALASRTSAANIWSDLAAARYTSAVAEDRAEELVQALADADAALRIQPDLAEALFNRALIIERLGIRDPAIAAWESFLDLESRSEWANEARERLSELSKEVPDFRKAFEADYDRLASDRATLARLVTEFRQDARVNVETETLGEWGDAMVAGDERRAVRHLAVATAIGAELARSGGEAIIERAVAAIAAATGPQRGRLAEGHRDFRVAMKTFRSGRPGEAEPIFRRAAGAFSAGGSPMVLLARFFAGYMRYEQGDVRGSTPELQKVLAEIPHNFTTVRARVRWQLAICRGAEGHWGDAIEYAEAGVQDFERAGEKYYAAVLEEHVAEGYQLIGDGTTAWIHRGVALREIGRTSSRLLQAILGFMSQEAILRSDWREASSFTALELEVAEKARFLPVVAAAHLRRARILQQLGGGDPANELARGRIAIASIPDAGMRSRLEARLVAVEAAIAPSAKQALELLTTAIDFHDGPRGQRMLLPTLLLHRSRTHRALGELETARRDLDAALGELDSGRATLSASEQRTGIFESAESIVNEAIELALEQRDVRGAFGYSERARARSVLDAMQARLIAEPPGALPPSTAIIEYAITPTRATIFVVDGDSIRLATRPIDREDLQRRVATFADRLSYGGEAGRIGATLYRDLIEPVSAWIASKETLVIVPDATTRSVAFAALPLPRGGFLIEKHLLVSSPSAAVYHHALRQRQDLGAARTLLLIANDGADSPEMDALQRTSVESRRIMSLYSDVSSLVNASATRTVFLREAPRADLIHFAGHALSSEYRPEETAIMLAGEDGRLNAVDIADLRLRASTVVLSACSTARGKGLRFEGNLSVARAFLAAGVPSVVATLWPIDDADAAEFFPLVHQGLAGGLPPAKALRSAQLDFIRRSRPPSLWAAVQLIGS